MGTPLFKSKIQVKLKELDKKQESLGDSIGIPNKGNFSTKLSDASKFTVSEITKLAKELKFDNEQNLIIDTELFCDKNFEEFLSIENVKECEIIKLKKIIQDNEDKPLGRTELAFVAFFAGIITTFIIQFLSKL